MALFVVDVESDGQIIGQHSIVCFGVVKVTPELNHTFYGKTKPISDIYIPEALAISGFNREEHLKFNEPLDVMSNFASWLNEHSGNSRPILISDNNGYDSAWINYYFHRFYGSNPFGWTSRRIGDLFCGAEHDMHYKWKQHRDNIKYPHNHQPLSDALGNASALLYFFNKYNMKIPK